MKLCSSDNHYTTAPHNHYTTASRNRNRKTETERFPVASETQTLEWKEQIIFGDWVLVQYNTFYPGEVKNKSGDNIQVNVMIPPGKTRWKWPKKEDSIYYERSNIIKKINPPEATSGTTG